jgi:hypothetical protein
MGLPQRLRYTVLAETSFGEDDCLKPECAEVCVVNGGAVLECGNCLPPSVCPNQGGRLNAPQRMLFRLNLKNEVGT